MRNAAIAALVILAAAALAIAQTAPQSTAPAQTSSGTVLNPPATATESPLVRAARQAKANRKSTTKVITNKDVKRSKGKLAISSPPPLPVEAAKAKADKRSPLERQDAQYHARKAAQARVTTAEAKVSELEKDLAAIEQAYYEEKDLNRRDDEIQKRFAQTRRQLEDARKDLADARDSVSALNPQPYAPRQ